MASTARIDLIDRLLEGRFWDLIDGWQDERLSYYEISLRLRDQHGINVTPTTLGRWIKQRPASARSRGAA